MPRDRLSQFQLDALLTMVRDGIEPNINNIAVRLRLRVYFDRIKGCLIRTRRQVRNLAWRRYNVEGPLREIKNTLQIKGLPHRRWFANSQFDLIVEDHMGEIVGFRIDYAKHGSSITSLEWDREFGTTNGIGTEGESGPLKNKRPILNRESVADVFRQAAGSLPEPISEMVFMHLKNYECGQATNAFLRSLTNDERADIHRRAEALWQKHGEQDIEEQITLRGRAFWLQARETKSVNVPTHEEVKYIQDIVISDEHHVALQRWWAAQKPSGFRYGEPFAPILSSSEKEP